MVEMLVCDRDLTGNIASSERHCDILNAVRGQSLVDSKFCAYVARVRPPVVLQEAESLMFLAKGNKASCGTTGRRVGRSSMLPNEIGALPAPVTYVRTFHLRVVRLQDAKNGKKWNRPNLVYRVKDLI